MDRRVCRRLSHEPTLGSGELGEPAWVGEQGDGPGPQVDVGRDVRRDLFLTELVVVHQIQVEALQCTAGEGLIPGGRESRAWLCPQSADGGILGL